MNPEKQIQKTKMRSFSANQSDHETNPGSDAASSEGKERYPVIELNHVSKSFNGRRILNNVSLCVSQGDFVAIEGPSGAGKTTLLNCMGLLDRADEGDLIIMGCKNPGLFTPVSRRLLREEIGWIVQNYALIEDKTVYFNLKYALSAGTRRNSRQRIAKALRFVGLEGFENAKVYTLSGGEQQRVAIARLLVKNCRIILADEPTGSLDPKNRDLVLSLLKKLQEAGKTIVVVSHDPVLLAFADRSVRIEDHQLIEMRPAGIAEKNNPLNKPENQIGAGGKICA